MCDHYEQLSTITAPIFTYCMVMIRTQRKKNRVLQVDAKFVKVLLNSPCMRSMLCNV